ncbi:HNH endonuclease domain-containing protein [Shewanella sp. UCD-KL12]|uniref:HNH endonuclease n=1 Tax=Shewanella sp. UCD-KL12 TaxID=1917163 RepID=UPI000970ADA8
MNSDNFEVVDAQKQVNFIAYLQRLLVEGEFNATYKFALLHALADICIERPINNKFRSSSHSSGMQNIQQNVIIIDELVEKFIELYWQHSLPYMSGEKCQVPTILLQNSGSQSALINNLAYYREQGIRTLSQLKKNDNWGKLMSQTRRTLKEGPLWRLQLLAGKEECYFYPHTGNNKQIVLNPDIAYCFRRFHDLVVSLARSHWTQKVCSLLPNQSLIGGQGDLSDFLFGCSRKSLFKARPVLYDIQKGRCFYCNKSINEDELAITKNEIADTSRGSRQKMMPEVDHFIPRARYPNDLAHNFVLAHGKCNKAKSDHLAAEEHKDRWFEQNIILNSSELTERLQPYFNCDQHRTEAIATWAYKQAAHNGSMLWLKGKSFEVFDQNSIAVAPEQPDF